MSSLDDSVYNDHEDAGEESVKDCDMDSNSSDICLNPKLLEPEVCLVKQEQNSEDEYDQEREITSPDPYHLDPLAHVKVEHNVDEPNQSSFSGVVDESRNTMLIEEKEEQIIDDVNDKSNCSLMQNLTEDTLSFSSEDSLTNLLNNFMDQDEMKMESMSDNSIDSTFLPFLNGGDDESSSSSDDELPYELAMSYNLDSRSELLQRLPTQQGSKTWNVSNEFFPLPAAPPMDEEDKSIYLVRPIDAFYRYIPEKVISDLALATSQRISLETNSNVVVTTQTMKQFIGANIVMSYIRYPRIRMYWEAKTFIPQIADIMSRKLFTEIRHYLTCRDYNTVTKEEKKINLFWKINPILECVRNACLANPRSKNVSIYKQIVPLRSQAKKILVKGKPNPVVLKNFVLTAQDGLPLDFFLYQDKEVTDIYPKLKLDLGGKVALKLSESLLPGCNLYMNHYFTSLTVMEVLFPLGIHCTGILQKQRIPEDCDFGLNSDFRGRGSFVQLVRDDGQFSIVKWFDEKFIVIASNVHGALPEDYVAYWKKSRNSYIHVNRPNVVSRYNMNMKGVELLEGMMDRYRISAKSINWTVKTIFHFIDFAILAAWIERKRVDKKKITRDRIELIDFKVELANSLLHCGSGENCQVNDSREVLALNVGLSYKRRVIPLPSDAVRSSGALHLPEKPVGAKLSRCRLPGCRHSNCRFWCKTCKVFLCLTSTRNCFKQFHEL